MRAVLPLFFLLLVSCGGPDVKIINQVKTFGPQWVSLKERLAALDKNMMDIDGMFERHYQDYENSFGKLRDSASSALGDSLRGVYRNILEVRGNIADSIASIRKHNEERAESFYDWEKKVMAGKFSDADASTELRRFKEEFSALETSVKKQEDDFDMIISKHNSLFRRLGQLFNSPMNFDYQKKF